MTERKIILLSDGTGNSSAKITKTNVWRIYQAIDLSQGDQIAFYDDGVGTGGLKFMRMLGGAFGFGLARNVRHLYEDLCRHYKDGDQILLFGFSRGAFTVRVLSGMIEHCGIIDRNSTKAVKTRHWSRLGKVELPVSSDAGLKAAIRVGYRALRKRNDKAPISNLFRWLRDMIFTSTPTTEEFKKEYSVSPRPRIGFIGVFDTVSAYGLPIDEMTIAIHKWIFPLRFPNMILSRKVEHACQALALDEARHTFHPVLWTERTFDPAGGNGEPDTRPLQAWFPGMHSNVGGGYGDDRLSFVPAIWMLEEAQSRTNLRLAGNALTELKAQATGLGRMHESRSGFGSFYRYKPRILDYLGNEDIDGNGYAEVRIDRFKIHQATFERIRASGADYAPVGIPEDYDVVRSNPGGSPPWQVVSADVAGYEQPAQRAQRMIAQSNLRDLVFVRQLLYFIMIAAALGLAIVPLIWRPNPAVVADGIASEIVAAIASLLEYSQIPKIAQMGEYWTQHPYWFFAVAAVFVLCYLASASLAGAIQSGAQQAWAHVAGKQQGPIEPRWQWINAWRSHTGPMHRWWTKNVLPLLSVLVLFVALPALALWRICLVAAVDFDGVCPDQAAQIFETRDPCMNTGAELSEGHDYTIRFTIKDGWQDKSLPAGPDGIQWADVPLKQRLLMAASVPSRRFLTEDWFVMMGSIGTAREDAFPLDLKQAPDDPQTLETTIRAWRSGPLYLFVNDAIGVYPVHKACEIKESGTEWRCFYDNNKGNAVVEIKQRGGIGQ